MDVEPFHCKCGWSRVVLDGETMEDARRKHEGTVIHRLAMEFAEDTDEQDGTLGSCGCTELPHGRPWDDLVDDL